MQTVHETSRMWKRPQVIESMWVFMDEIIWRFKC